VLPCVGTATCGVLPTGEYGSVVNVQVVGVGMVDTGG
jgi:hypothetical protein